jgi:hypothetical protein
MFSRRLLLVVLLVVPVTAVLGKAADPKVTFASVVGWIPQA